MENLRYIIPKEMIRIAAVEGYLKIYHEYEAADMNGWDKAEARRLIDKHIADLYRDDAARH